MSVQGDPALSTVGQLPTVTIAAPRVQHREETTLDLRDSAVHLTPPVSPEGGG